jgi:hypothetical protein
MIQLIVVGNVHTLSLHPSTNIKIFVASLWVASKMFMLGVGACITHSAKLSWNSGYNFGTDHLWRLPPKETLLGLCLGLYALLCRDYLLASTVEAGIIGHKPTG